MRRHFDPDALNELSRSMKEEGLIQPIVVRPVGQAFELIAGERRLRAAEILGWETIEARVIEANDEGAAVKGLIENLQRADLSPIEEARGYKQLVEPPYNLTQEEVSRRVGKCQSAIARALALLELPEEIQALMPRGMVTESHARLIRKLPEKRKQVELAKRIDREGLSVRETERLLNGNAAPVEKDIMDAPLIAQPPARRRNDHVEEADPLASLWPQLLFTPQVATPETWDIRYEGNSQWQLDIWVENDKPKKNLGDFFIRLGKAIKEAE